MQLRPYQLDAISGVKEKWSEGQNNVCLVLPTGAGKTITKANLVKQMGLPTMCMAHRQELILQISESLAEVGIQHKIVAPDSVNRFCTAIHIKRFGKAFTHGSDVMVSSVQTLVGRKDKLRHLFGRVKLWDIDESHHVQPDNLWGKGIDLLPKGILGLGVTATPLRCDRKGLDGVFDAMVVGPSMRELINMNFLSDYRIYCPPVSINRDAIRTSASSGEMIQADLVNETHRSSIVGDVVQHYLRIAPGKRAIVFAVDLASARLIMDAFTQAGVPAAYIDGNTPDRERVEALGNLGTGLVKAVVNVDILGEGVDCPAVEVVSMARATQSYGLYCLDPDTEILTPDGWKRHDEIGVGDEMAAFDPQHETIQTVRVDDVIKRPMYDDEYMIQYRNAKQDILVSDRHRMLVRGQSSTSVNWHFQTADEVMNRKAMFTLPVAAHGTHTGCGLTQSQLHLIGWYLSDGCLNPANNALGIGQSATKIKHLEHIRASIEGCGFKYGEYRYVRKNVPSTHNDVVTFTISKGVPRGRDKHLTGWGGSAIEPYLDKTIPAVFDSMTRDEFLTMIEALNLGDGSNNHDSLTWTKRSLTIACGDNERMADRLQAMCVTRGLRCLKSTVKYEGRGRWWIIHIKDVRRVSVAGQNIRDGKISGKKSYKRSRFERSEIRPPFVWCVTNKLGTIVTRRNGKVTITGNCQQFGRALRLAEGKTHATIIDHVGNVVAHGLPDQQRIWSLAGGRVQQSGDAALGMTVCATCMQPRSRIVPVCPYCGATNAPQTRSAPEYVDGDLIELDPEVLAAMRGEVVNIESGSPAIPYGASGAIVGRKVRDWGELCQAQHALRESMAHWSGIYHHGHGECDRTIQRRFYATFNIDMLSAQALRRADAEKLNALVRAQFT